MCKITFLGPIGATFSHDAYNVLSRTYRSPDAITDGKEMNCVPAAANTDILGLVSGHGGFGAIAMETLEGGRVSETLETFIKLLATYRTTLDCPFRIAGAVKMKIRFCLMAKATVELPSIKKIVAHPKAFGPCKGRIASTGAVTVEASSNGEAARLVAEDPAYAACAALGPRSAAEKYGLTVLDGAFEDKEAITTFFLLAPKTSPVSSARENRILIVFKLPHEPGALIKALMPFAEEGLNLIQIHSMHAGNGAYEFAIQIEARGQKSAHDYADCQLKALGRAMEKFGTYVSDHIAFGPFPVLSR